MNSNKRVSSLALLTSPPLLLLTFINLFNYLDRYILVALSPTIKSELALSDLSVGLLVTAFMFSYFLISPLFGWLGDRKPRYQLMAVGVALWSLATIASGLVKSFTNLLASRLCVGVGEAAYGSISPSVLTDLFPKAVRGRVFAIFFMAIPVGSALGYLLGGLLEKLVGWRHAFLLAGAPGLVLAALLLLLTEPKRGALDPEAKEETAGYGGLLRNKGYVATVLGYAAYTFVVGGIAVWIPHYMVRFLGVNAADGNMSFGTVTVLAGLLGTLLGGSWADRWAKRGTDAYLKLSAVSIFAAIPVFALALRMKTFSEFNQMVFCLEFLLFLSTSPVNAQIVNMVPANLRAAASAGAIFCIHLFGDAISPSFVGMVSDHSDLRLALWVMIPFLFACAGIWSWKVIWQWESLPWPEKGLLLPKAQCHRGYRAAGVQENTLQSFRDAAKAGAEMIELDVRLSADGIPVVVHDADLQRVAGQAGMVAALSAPELRSLGNVPSLSDVLTDTECASLKVNIEIKSQRLFADGLEEAVAFVVAASHSEGRVMISSFNPFSLRRISRYLPQVPRALLASGDRSDPANKFYLRQMLLAFLARPHMVNLDAKDFTPARARNFAQRMVPVSVWTVNDPAQARNLLALGAKSIISDQPKIV